MTLAQKILYLTKNLYPSGRAFRIPIGSILEKVHIAVNVTEANVYNSAVGVLDTILADNDNFTVDDAADWERRLGLDTDSAVALADRKLAINRKYASPGNKLYRQSAVYMEAQLQAAGFDVYVHENREDDGMGGYQTVEVGVLLSQQYGGFQYGGGEQYGPSANSLPVVANKIDQSLDDNWSVPVDQRAMFYIGGVTLGIVAEVPEERREELRKLILTLKPLHTAAFLIIDYT